MAIFELTRTGIAAIAETTFSAKGWRERDDLQRVLRDRIELISPDTLVIAEEFGEWDESSRRIDLLGIDKQANLVVIELKRTADGGHMDLQAIRYASMVSKMTFDRALEVFADYLVTRGQAAVDARETLLELLPDTRHWEHCRRYGYVSAGGAKRYRSYLAKLRPGDPIFAYVKGSAGYVGYGVVVSEAVPFDAFRCADGTRLADALKCPDKNRGRSAEDAEYAVGVRWLRTFKIAEG